MCSAGRNHPRYNQTEQHLTVYDEIVSWALTYRGTPRHAIVPKNVLSGLNNPLVQSKPSYKLDFRQNLLLGINESRHTEIVSNSVLTGSKNPQVQSKPSNRLRFRTKTSPEQQHVEVHLNRPQKRTQPVKITPGTAKPRNILRFRTKSSPEHQRVEVHQNRPQKSTYRVEKPPGTFKTELQTVICDQIVS